MEPGGIKRRQGYFFRGFRLLRRFFPCALFWLLLLLLLLFPWLFPWFPRCFCCCCCCFCFWFAVSSPPGGFSSCCCFLFGFLRCLLRYWFLFFFPFPFVGGGCLRLSAFGSDPTAADDGALLLLLLLGLALFPPGVFGFVATWLGVRQAGTEAALVGAELLLLLSVIFETLFICGWLLPCFSDLTHTIAPRMSRPNLLRGCCCNARKREREGERREVADQNTLSATYSFSAWKKLRRVLLLFFSSSFWKDYKSPFIINKQQSTIKKTCRLDAIILAASIGHVLTLRCCFLHVRVVVSASTSQNNRLDLTINKITTEIGF